MNHRSILASSWLLLVSLSDCAQSHDGPFARSLQDIELSETNAIATARTAHSGCSRKRASLIGGTITATYDVFGPTRSCRRKD